MLDLLSNILYQKWLVYEVLFEQVLNSYYICVEYTVYIYRTGEL